MPWIFRDVLGPELAVDAIDAPAWRRFYDHLLGRMADGKFGATYAAKTLRYARWFLEHLTQHGVAAPANLRGLKIKAAPGPVQVFTPEEVRVLDHLGKDKDPDSAVEPTLAIYVHKLARLGGYLARTGDGPPGTMVMWRGLARLTDIALGFQLGARLVGN